MPTQVTTPPVGEPLTLAEAKAHLRVTHADEDAYIMSLITTARQHVEQASWQSLLTQTLTLTLYDFPHAAQPIYLPGAPVQSVTSLTYIDAAGDAQPLTTFQADLAASPPRLIPAVAQVWPLATRQVAAVTVVYQAGFGAAEDVPEPLKQAMRLLIGDFYHYREDEPRPRTARAVDALLSLNNERDARLADMVG